MNNFAVFVVGPAGGGKTSICASLAECALSTKRTVQICNLDAAAVNLPYEPTLDIRDVAPLNKVMKKYGLGPNGGLLKCFDVYMGSTHLDDALRGTSEHYMFVDCPGQIEVYLQSGAFKEIIQTFGRHDFACCSMYALDASFVQAPDKYISGATNALVTSIRLGLPSMNILTKADLVMQVNSGATEDDIDPQIEPYMSADLSVLVSDKSPPLTKLLVDLCHEYGLNGFQPVSIHDNDTLLGLLGSIDNLVQYENEHATLEDYGGHTPPYDF